MGYLICGGIDYGWLIVLSIVEETRWLICVLLACRLSPQNPDLVPRPLYNTVGLDTRTRNPKYSVKKILDAQYQLLEILAKPY